VVLNFEGVLILRVAIFCVLWELIFAIGKDWFFFLGTNFCDFHEVAFNWDDYIFVF